MAIPDDKLIIQRCLALHTVLQIKKQQALSQEGLAKQELTDIEKRFESVDALDDDEIAAAFKTPKALDDAEFLNTYYQIFNCFKNAYCCKYIHI